MLRVRNLKYPCRKLADCTCRRLSESHRSCSYRKAPHSVGFQLASGGRQVLDKPDEQVSGVNPLWLGHTLCGVASVLELST
jgi:hypothetical protein